jgi:peptidoglycan/xylan/chitin deacetylase (PgdA/CDA1 family)
MSRATAAAVATGLIGWGLPACASHVPIGRALGIRYDSGDARRVALTFDDGPQPRGTELILEVLARHDVTATFFVVGLHAQRHPRLVQELVAAGHDVQSHGYLHGDHLVRTPADIRTDMRRGRDVIGDIIGHAPTLYRPPHGVATWTTLRAARGLGQQVVLWTRWGRDWEARATPSSIARHATRHVAGGDTILLHDATWYGRGRSARTAEALDVIIERVRAAGLEPGQLVTPGSSRVHPGSVASIRS